LTQDFIPGQLWSGLFPANIQPTRRWLGLCFLPCFLPVSFSLWRGQRPERKNRPESRFVAGRHTSAKLLSVGWPLETAW